MFTLSKEENLCFVIPEMVNKGKGLSVREFGVPQSIVKDNEIETEF